MGDEVYEVRPVGYGQQPQHDPALDGEAPELSVSDFMDSIRSKGFAGTMADERMGPHSHLILILSIVMVMTIVVTVMTFA